MTHFIYVLTAIVCLVGFVILVQSRHAQVWDVLAMAAFCYLGICALKLALDEEKGNK